MFNTFDETLGAPKKSIEDDEDKEVQIIDELAVQLPTRESIPQEQGE